LLEPPSKKPVELSVRLPVPQNGKDSSVLALCIRQELLESDNLGHFTTQPTNVNYLLVSPPDHSGNEHPIIRAIKTIRKKNQKESERNRNMTLGHQ
jgi:hypothetical protein